MLRDGEQSDDICDFLGYDPDIEERGLVLNRSQQRHTTPASTQTGNPQTPLASGQEANILTR